MSNNISSLGQALDRISQLKTQQRSLDQLTNQITTGKKTQKFSGLGSEALTSQRARANINALDTYINNIKSSNRRITEMSNGIQTMKDQANDVQDSLAIAVQNGDYPDLKNIQSVADNIYDFVIDIMNSKDGDRYLYAGADSNTKPVSNNGLFDSFIGEYKADPDDPENNPPSASSGLVGQWVEGDMTTDDFIKSYRNTNETVMGYSDSLVNKEAGKVGARVNDDSELDYTVLANTPGMKQIMTAIGVLKAMPPAAQAPGALNDPDAAQSSEDTAPVPSKEKQDNFFKVVRDLSTMLEDGVNKLNQEGYRLSQVKSRLDQIQKSHREEVNTLQSIVSDVEDVDMTEAATKINQLQVQLEASYRVTALMSDLSLSKFI